MVIQGTGPGHPPANDDGAEMSDAEIDAFVDRWSAEYADAVRAELDEALAEGWVDPPSGVRLRAHSSQPDGYPPSGTHRRAKGLP